MKKRMLAVVLVLCMVLAMIPAAFAADEGDIPETAVYLNGTSGNDEADGTTAENAVKTLDKALELAKDQENCVIYITGMVTISGETALNGVTFRRGEDFTGKLFLLSGSDKKLTLTNVTVDGGQVKGVQGGMIQVSGGATLEIGEGTNLVNNYGTAIEAYNSTVNMTGGKISNNQALAYSALGCGGGMYLQNSDANLTGGEISDNYAVLSGGAISCFASRVTLDGTVIQNNISGERGGAIYIEGYSGIETSFTMISGSVIDNGTEAGQGGGIYAEQMTPEDNTSVVIRGGTIAGNVFNLGGKYETESAIAIADLYEENPDTDKAVKLELSGSPTISGLVLLNDWYDGGPYIQVTGEFTPTNPVLVQDVYGREGRVVVAFADGVEPNAAAFTSQEGSSSTLVQDGQYLKWAKTVRISFNQVTSREDTAWQTKNVYILKGIAIPEDKVPAAAEIPGYERTGWQYYSDGSWKTWDMSTTVTENLTLYEIWKPVLVTGVTLNQTELTMIVDETATLTAQIVPENALNQNVSWSSDKPEVAKVDENGTITAVSAGTATITVTTEDGSKTATCTVTVQTHEDVCPSKDFTDLNPDAWYHEAIDYVVEQDIMQGISEKEFSPETETTRAQLAQIFYNMEGNPEYTTDKSFSDVQNQEAWYYDAVMWAASQGIVTGYEDGTFQPDRSVSRQEMVTMFRRYAAYAGVLTDEVTETLDEFPDVDETWAKDAFAWAVQNGIIDGKDGKLAPADMTRRCEIAKVILAFSEAVSE